VKFFYRNIYTRHEPDGAASAIAGTHRPKKDYRLPVLLDKQDVRRTLEAEENLKHRLLLTLVYSAGLRVSEAVALKVRHIDLQRKLILVVSGNGRKDRYTMLAHNAEDLFIEYCRVYQPETWLFPGGSLARIFRFAVRKNYLNTPKRKPEYKARRAFTVYAIHYAIHSQPTFWKAARTSVIFRICWGIALSKQPSATPM
jgi:site-specific recombinase XerD